MKRCMRYTITVDVTGRYQLVNGVCTVL